MKRDRPLVTIDGPAGAGKSTVSRDLARRLGFTYLDTGAIYRAVALAVTERLPEITARLEMERAQLPDADQATLGALARMLDVRFTESGIRIWLDGRDVSEAIRSPRTSQLASSVSAVAAVRSALLDLQRKIGDPGGVVAEGRDMGSVVFPDAEVKFFLTADPVERARRRAAELRARGVAADETSTLREILARDERDAGRDVAPLVCPEGAIVIDSSKLSAEAVVEAMLEGVNARQNA